jgi:hypothetical protein
MSGTVAIGAVVRFLMCGSFIWRYALNGGGLSHPVYRRIGDCARKSRCAKPRV